MSYEILVIRRELEEFSTVTIFGRSEHYKSVQICRFQCIGWLWQIREEVFSLTRSEYLTNPNYFLDALVNIACLSPNEASEMNRLTSQSDAFRFSWSVLSSDERAIALALDPQYFDNFWPFFDPTTINAGIQEIIADAKNLGEQYQSSKLQNLQRLAGFAEDNDTKND